MDGNLGRYRCSQRVEFPVSTLKPTPDPTPEPPLGRVEAGWQHFPIFMPRFSFRDARIELTNLNQSASVSVNFALWFRTCNNSIMTSLSIQSLRATYRQKR